MGGHSSSVGRANGMHGLRGSRADVGQLPLEICKGQLSEAASKAARVCSVAECEFLTLLELFQALESDLELVVVGEPGWVVEDIDP